MRKAFLCHSSADKHYARIVANKLGRAQVAFDEFSFLPGQDFRDEIIRHLDKSALFVFLVSRASLDSHWCRFELDQAQIRSLHGGIEAQLALIIDRDVSYEDLPPWLRNAKATLQPRPSQAARDIQYSLFAVLSPEIRKPFIGRQTSLQEFGTGLVSSGDHFPRIMIVSGLEGIGRRSFLERASLDFLDLRLGPSFLIDETIGLDDVYLHVLDETSDIGSRVDMAAELESFRKLSGQGRVGEIVNRLQILSRDGQIPCFVDLGGMLTNTGEYRPEFLQMMEMFLSSNTDEYLGFVHRRTPHIRELPFIDAILHQKLPQMSDTDVRLLLTQLLRRKAITAKTDQIREVVEFLDGYPPAAYYATAHVEKYGMTNLLADRSVLVDFKAKRFTRFLADLDLSDLEWSIVEYLTAEMALPLGAIVMALKREPEAVAAALRALIDKSLVVVSDDNYVVAAPIRDSIFRVRGPLASSFYGKVLDRLKKGYWSQGQTAPPIEVVDATLHAAALSGSRDFGPYQDVVRVSTIHRFAQESYHQRRWHEALEYALRAELMDAERIGVKTIAFKSLVQMEEWDKATSKLTEIERLEAGGGPWYLRGFMLRRRGDIEEAKRCFETALEMGNRSISVYRDYADVLYRLGNYDKAEAMVQIVLGKDPENVYILDLMARIHIEQGDLDNAQQVLNDLERFDLEKRFIHHRRASLYARQSLWDLAEEEARLACKSVSLFEAHAQLADILIERSKFEEFFDLAAEIRKRFGLQRKDIQAGLRCKAFIRQGRWREAEGIWNEIRDRERPVHRRLWIRILEMKSEDSQFSISEREAFAEEAEVLREELGLGSGLEDFE